MSQIDRIAAILMSFTTILITSRENNVWMRSLMESVRIEDTVHIGMKMSH